MEDVIRVGVMKSVHTCISSRLVSLSCEYNNNLVEKVGRMFPRVMKYGWNTQAQFSPELIFTVRVHCMLPLKPYVDSYEPTLLHKSCERPMHSF